MIRPFPCAAAALALTAGTWVQAVPTLCNLSTRTWTLCFSELDERAERFLKLPRAEETVLTVTWTTGNRSVRMGRSGCHGRQDRVAIARNETVFLTFRGRRGSLLQEVLTLEDSEGSRERCAILLMDPAAVVAGKALPARTPASPYFVVDLTDSFQQAHAFQTRGAVLKERDQITLLARSYAEVLGAHPGDTVLSPILEEGAGDASPAAPDERKLPPAPPMALPAPAQRGAGTSPAVAAPAP